jgi:hypothetical protein
MGHQVRSQIGLQNFASVRTHCQKYIYLICSIMQNFWLAEKKIRFGRMCTFGGLQDCNDYFFICLIWSLSSHMFHLCCVFNKGLFNLICHLASIWSAAPLLNCSSFNFTVSISQNIMSNVWFMNIELEVMRKEAVVP